jgi:hypothetical protein
VCTRNNNNRDDAVVVDDDDDISVDERNASATAHRA